jgi:hypothetical protein
MTREGVSKWSVGKQTTANQVVLFRFFNPFGSHYDTFHRSIAIII